MSSQVDKLARISLHEPLHIGLKEDEEDSMPGKGGNKKKEQEGTPTTLTKEYIEVPAKLRLVSLLGTLRKKVSEGKVIVFVSSCASCDFHAWLLAQKIPALRGSDDEEVPLVDSPVFCLHGDRAQVDRTKAYIEFSRAKRGILVCTNVAARGLDMPNVRHVIQYDPPEDAKEFVHQVGRTGRLGAVGDALLFLLPSETGYLQVLAKEQLELKAYKMKAALDNLVTDPASETAESLASHLQYHIEKKVEGEEAGLLARNGFRSRIRAYATYPASIKEIFHVRRLHLGHMAKSFGLREQPSLTGKKTKRELESTGGKGKKVKAGKEDGKKDRNSGSAHKGKTLQQLSVLAQGRVSEFG